MVLLKYLFIKLKWVFVYLLLIKGFNISAICDHLLHFLPSFDNFCVLAHENKKVLIRN